MDTDRPIPHWYGHGYHQNSERASCNCKYVCPNIKIASSSRQGTCTYTGIDVEEALGVVGPNLNRDHVDPMLAQHGHHHCQQAALPRHAHVDDRLVVQHTQHDIRCGPGLEPDRPRRRRSLRRHGVPAVRHGRHPVRGARHREGGRPAGGGLSGGLPRKCLLQLLLLQLGFGLL